MNLTIDDQKKARRRLDIRPTNIEDEIYKDCYVVEMFNAGTVLSSDSDRQGRKMIVIYVSRQLNIHHVIDHI